MSVAALIVAAGRGSRAAGAGRGPKQYAKVSGVAVLRLAIDAFVRHPAIDVVKVVIHCDDRAAYDEANAGAGDKLAPPCIGGASRQDSVRLGLEALAQTLPPPDVVLIHDAARPFVAAAVIERVMDALDAAPAAIAAVPVSDTLKRAVAGASGCAVIAETVGREELWRAQTPQAFRFGDILELHRRASEEDIGGFTDDAALAEWGGLGVALALGAEENRKLTTAEDIAMAERMYGVNTIARETRTATGFDVHRFADGDHVWLGGVKIVHTRRLEGHSDADVALHALTDALLGTIGDGDIGQHFPPTDPKWKGAASILFLKDAARRVWAREGRIVNVDLTILAEAPKVGPHRPAMQAAIAEALGIAPDRVGIKATTMEQMGFVGRGEGIAAMASATVTLPQS